MASRSARISPVSFGSPQRPDSARSVRSSPPRRQPGGSHAPHAFMSSTCALTLPCSGEPAVGSDAGEGASAVQWPDSSPRRVPAMSASAVQFAPSALTCSKALVRPSACFVLVGSCTRSDTPRSPLLRASWAATCHWPSKAACTCAVICRSPCQPRSGCARAISCATENGASDASTDQCPLAPGAAGAVQNDGGQSSDSPANSAPPAPTRSVCQSPAALRDRLRSSGLRCTQFGLTTVGADAGAAGPGGVAALASVAARKSNCARWPCHAGLPTASGCQRPCSEASSRVALALPMLARLASQAGGLTGASPCSCSWCCASVPEI